MARAILKMSETTPIFKFDKGLENSGKIPKPKKMKSFSKRNSGVSHSLFFSFEVVFLFYLIHCQ